MKKASIALAALALLAACSAFGARRTDTLQVPPGTSTVRLFACTEDSLTALGHGSSFWPGVSRKDVAGGVLETGNYPEDNVIGFRVRMSYAAGSQAARIEMKAFGPYFTDLGAGTAMSDLRSAIARCLTTRPSRG